MNAHRRSLLLAGGALTLGSAAAALWPATRVQAADYKALVVVLLRGGHDGNNMLVPIDGAYGDYARARPALALPRESLLPLSGTHICHRFGFSPSMKPLHTLFERRRLAVVANVGALVQPTTLEQVRNRTAKLPFALGSHLDQQRWVQGWMADERQSGWGGRAMEQFPASMRSRQPLVSLSSEYMTVTSDRIGVSLADSAVAGTGNTLWGFANYDRPTDSYSQRVEAQTRRRSLNDYETEFARSLRAAWEDARMFSAAQQQGPQPSGDFPADTKYSRIGSQLRYVARYLPYSRAQGAQRQVVLLEDDGYDTHADQLSTSKYNPGLDRRLEGATSALVAFDQSMVDAGMDQQVLVLVVSEFGRTLEASAGLGTDHAWGNHWFALGGMVKGGAVLGDTFPALQIGGPDDASFGEPKRGQWLPQFSSDQFVADALRWMGLDEAQTLKAVPNLANFARRSVGYL